jgi:hypothetical protein
MSKTIELKLKVKLETDKAILVENLVGKDVWLPISQLNIIDRSNFLSSIDKFEVPVWLAKDKELI